ncbi:hypothetical protein GC197_06370 [bacterium]|nr:hypothetical protein [bacterium]
MKTFAAFTTLAFLLVLTNTQSAECEDYKPQLFKSVKLIYDEQFDTDGPITKDNPHWITRQGTPWNVKDGVLTGSIASEEYQKMMRAKGDSHDGTRTVVWLKPVPEAFAIQMRVRYNNSGKKGRNRGCLLDLGHHVNSFIFGEEETTLTLQKKKKIQIDGKFFPLNQWNGVTIEIKEGEIVMQVNDRKEVIRDPLITMKESQQIDFKGQDLETIQIDWVKLYEPVE